MKIKTVLTLSFPGVSLCMNQTSFCPFAVKGEIVEHLTRVSRLYAAFDLFYADIWSVCKDCHDRDCEGYVWLLREEADTLYDKDVSVVEINENTWFLHSFEEHEGQLVVDRPRPPCRLRENNSCSIYGCRPLVCRMYPVGLAMVGDEVALVLHQDCEFSRRLNADKSAFLARVIQIFRQTPADLLDTIEETFRAVHAISAFPEGPNSYELIVSFETLRKGGYGYV